MTPTSHEKLGLALGLAGVLLFGGTLPATRLAVAAFDPLFLSAARATIAGLAGLILLLAARKPLPPPATWSEFILAAVCTIIGFPVLMALAMVQRAGCPWRRRARRSAAGNRSCRGAHRT